MQCSCRTGHDPKSLWLRDVLRNLSFRSGQQYLGEVLMSIPTSLFLTEMDVRPISGSRSVDLNWAFGSLTLAAGHSDGIYCL